MNLELNRTKILIGLEVFFHLLFWLWFLFSVNVVWTQGWMIRAERIGSIAPLSVLLFPIIFYVNAFFWIPRYLKGKNWWFYFIVVLGSWLLLELLRSILFISFNDYDGTFLDKIWYEFLSRDNLLLGGVNSLFFAFFLSFAYRFTRDRITDGRLIEKLKSEKTIAELSLIKSQISPHFLFNNLNTLDTLIDQDKDLAKAYLHRLSGIFRYSITNMESDVVSLTEEWKHMEDYIFLLEERYGGSYVFQQEKDDIDMDSYLIPPASLQGLIENAVKHNQGSLDNPLITHILLNENGIKISHIKNLKSEEVPSLGTGLENLKARFKLLCNLDIEIIDEKEFAVKLPLIKKVDE